MVRFLVTLFLVLGWSPSTRAVEPPTAEELALKLLDGEGVYTVTGGLKPISESFWTLRFPAAEPVPQAVETVRSRLAALSLGDDLVAGVYLFSAAFDGKKSASAFVAHRPALRSLIVTKHELFASIGIHAETSPQEVLERIDAAPRSARWRAYGLVFGYPEYAVDFFVAAGESQDATKTFVERDFLRLPTFAADGGRFVYAVPKGHVERAEDRNLRDATEAISARYRAWRSVYVGEGKPGAAALLQMWVAPPPPLPRITCRPMLTSIAPGLHVRRRDCPKFLRRVCR